MSEIQVVHMDPPYSFEAYPHVLEPLTVDDGGGYLITFPDLPGCMSDGETIEEAIANGRDAFSAWMSARIHMGKPIPKPTWHGENRAPVRLMQRLPRSLHASLVARARAEGTSLNTLVTMLLAEGLGRREHHD
ncbi:type II toxin-antitoxin system HicB family antitoxin [Acidithiobacillus ferriphilus]|uniref:type II toxin-antitoxin system HicB family antitoxin n=1 Tax=Acidithiobacillus ferriphilus TaxID=1689834 RepID=UPI00232CACC7|nr:type II toxin-antitoxin system HicB family antitoxin [Acidithiobacillus ferriphilus]WCE92953.1 type II toxin-antitoxin system HicB family antitoxin [Acidithiobacillus ferriphilus]